MSFPRNIWYAWGVKILGIETSCDETAAGVVADGSRLMSSVVASSMNLHVPYGGVVPEIAARSHIEVITGLIQQALDEARCDWNELDGIAVTHGAGLGGCLLVGVMTARTLAITKGLPLYACNHVEGHVYANFISETDLTDYVIRETPSFPMLAIIVSGGHSQLALFRKHFDYTLLGQTRDDAIGEAFDKVAKILGLPYPGGPSVSKKALEGNPYKYDLPIAQLGPRQSGSGTRQRVKHSGAVQGGAKDRNEPYREVRRATTGRDNAAVRTVVDSGRYDFSYSGLKTAVLRLAQAETGHDYTFPSTKLPAELSEAQKADIAASFQRIAIKTIVDKATLAYQQFSPASVVIAGGVAASPELRRQLQEALPEVTIEYPDTKLCTDNGAMIATLGCYKALLGQPAADPYSLAIAPNLSM